MRLVVRCALLASLFAFVGSGSAFERTSTAASAFQLKRFARGFEAPILLTHAPGDPTALYVAEQPGRVIRLRAGRRTVFMDVRSDVAFGGEQGLLGLAFHPEYERNRLLYIAYTSRNGRNTVARYRSNGQAVVRSSRKLLLSVPDPYANHNGGQLAFGKDGMLYTTIGDGGSGGDPEDRAQDLGSLFGKLLRLDVSKPRADWAIAGLGLRNAWRFSFDRATGDLYLGDVGQGAIEEVSFTPLRSPGLENYGWDLYEGSRRFEAGEPSTGKLVFPLYEYGRSEGSCSVIGGYVYRGAARPTERGRYIFGDYCSGIVWSLIARSGEARSVRRERFRIEGLTSFGESSSGELYATTQNGVIYRLT
ncbi:MAG: PQQ-dependent sugar dehydrogenase [Actinobacteria bacterium]|nr:PQQ-dependent sugar dehydrogenase [Actinomycetota bacterium]